MTIESTNFKRKMTFKRDELDSASKMCLKFILFTVILKFLSLSLSPSLSSHCFPAGEEQN